MQQTKILTPFFSFGIRQKLSLILLIVLLTALTVSGWMALEQEKVNTLQEINQRGSDISRFVAKSLSYSVVGYDYHTIQLLVDEITLSEDISYARVTNQKGSLMAESGVKETDFASTQVLFTEDIKLNSKVVGKLELGLSTAKTIKNLEEKKYTILQREVFIVFLIAVGEFIALSFFIIRPVRIMSKTLVTSVDENGHIIDKIPIVSRDEFGQLAASFNYLSERLNDVNLKLQSKIELADKQLVKTNQQLLVQSEELKVISENFKKLSVTDDLTGLCNRRHFEQLLYSELETARRHGDFNSVIIFDIDYFKKVNDTYGHPCGDSVLRDIAKLLRHRMRKTDFFCRLGGEEFVVLCKRANKESVMMIAEDLRKTVEGAHFTCAEQVINITISIGVSTLGPEDEIDEPDIAYRQADQAVYYSKQNGRNCCTHFNDIKATEDEGAVNV